MSSGDGTQDFFEEVLHSQVATVVCGSCGSEVAVNKVYLPYLVDHRVRSCKKCPVKQQ
jgi:hypothetical protein